MGVQQVSQSTVVLFPHEERAPLVGPLALATKLREPGVVGCDAVGKRRLVPRHLDAVLPRSGERVERVGQRRLVVAKPGADDRIVALQDGVEAERYRRSERLAGPVHDRLVTEEPPPDRLGVVRIEQ